MRFENLQLKDFDEFYQVILGNFPMKEIKEYDYMKNTFSNGDYQVLTLKEDDKIKGILSYYDGGEFAFVDYFAIDGNQKGKGLGSKMLNHFMKMADKQVFLEVEHPEDEQSRRRIAFYQRNGLILNDQHDYFVPPVRNLKHRLYFHLMSYPSPITPFQFERYYPQILKLVYGIND